MLKLGDHTLVNRVYQLTRTLLFLARPKRLSTASTIEDGRVERLGQDVNQSLSQPIKSIPVTVRKAAKLTKLQAASYVGVR